MSYIPLKVNDSKNDFYSYEITMENDKVIARNFSGFTKEFPATELFHFLDKNELSILRLGITNQYRLSRKMIIVDNDGVLELCSKVSELFKKAKNTFKISDLKKFDKVILGNRYGTGEYLYLGIYYKYQIDRKKIKELSKVHVFTSSTSEIHEDFCLLIKNPLILNISDAPRVQINISKLKISLNEIQINSEEELLETYKNFHKVYLRSDMKFNSFIKFKDDFILNSNTKKS